MSSHPVTSKPKPHPSRKRSSKPRPPRAQRLSDMLALLAQRSPRAAEAVIALLEIMGQVDRARAHRLIEVVSSLVVWAPRFVAAQKRARR